MYIYICICITFFALTLCYTSFFFFLLYIVFIHVIVHDKVEWKVSRATGNKCDYRLRCIRHRMGGSLWETMDQGPWSQEENIMHINCLELLAATMEINTFLKYSKKISVLLLLDNTTAVAYIKNGGGGGQCPKS